jgi:hypothetical protein
MTASMTDTLTTRAFFARLLGFAAVVLVIQLAIGHRGRPEELELLDQVLEQQPDVLFFADSTNRAHDPGDSDRRWISQMLDDALDEILGGALGELPDGPPGRATGEPSGPKAGSVDVLSIDHAAYHPLVYLDWMEALLASGARPRAAVFVLNTRSFLPGWTMRPGWQFERLRYSLAHPLAALLWQPLAVFKVVQGNTVTEAGFRGAPVRIGTEPAGVVGDYLRGDPEALDTPELRDEDLRLRLTCNYLGAIHPEHERVAALRQLIALCLDHDVSPIFYVTPVDVATGEGFLPGQFRSQVAANAAFLVETVRAAGALALDLSTSTPSERFSWQRIPNEHMGQEGRRAVAEAVARVVAPMLLVDG